MKNPLEVLKAEHNFIKKMLGILEKICTCLNNPTTLNNEDISFLMNFFETFVEKCHSQKEEQFLFRELEKNGMPADSGPIAVMIYEHNCMKDLLAGMNKAILMGNVAEFTSLAYQYIDLLRNHIYKEDNVLFNMAEEILPGPTKNALTDSFEKFEREVIGEGVHENFHRIGGNLLKKYGILN